MAKLELCPACKKPMYSKVNPDEYIQYYIDEHGVKRIKSINPNTPKYYECGTDGCSNQKCKVPDEYKVEQISVNKRLISAFHKGQLVGQMYSTLLT